MKLKKYLLIFLSSFIFMFTNPIMGSAETTSLISKNQTLATSLDKKSKKKTSSENKLSEPVNEWYDEKFVLPGLYEYGVFGSSLEEKLMANHELSALTKELKDDLLYHNANRVRELIDERDDLVINGLLGSFVDTFKSTPIGKKYARFEKQVSVFLKTGYFKRDGEKGQIYYFGQLDQDKLDEKKDIETSLSVVLYTDKSLKEINCSTVLDFVFHKNKVKTIYNLTEKEFGINFTNDRINSFFGKNAEISLYVNKRTNNDESLIGAQLSFIF